MTDETNDTQARRTSFVFRTEWLAAMQVLDDTLQLELYKAITQYATAGTLPDGLSVAVQAVMSLIAPQIDAACDKYEAAVKAREVRREELAKARSEAGKRSGEARTNPSKREQTRTNGNKREQTGTNGNKPEQTRTNGNNYEYDNDNVYVSTYVDDDLDDINVNKPRDALADEVAEMLASETWQYEVQKSVGHTMEEIREMLPLFETDCRANGITRHNSMQDAKSHFCNWARKKDEVKRKGQKDKNPHDQKRDNSNRRRAAIAAKIIEIDTRNAYGADNVTEGGTAEKELPDGI